MPRSQSSGEVSGAPSERIVAIVVLSCVPKLPQVPDIVPYVRSSCHCIRHIVSLPGAHLKYMTPH